MKHYNIPVFLPELACPHRCVFCNQFSIVGKQHIPTNEDVKQIIELHLNSFKQQERVVELAFFGGNFTGLPERMQDSYLEVVQPYLKSNLIQGIRCSTRPDYIDSKRLKILKSYGVQSIELGAQSTDSEILRLSGRGHTFEDIQKSSKMILNEGFNLGLQMMIGLPCDHVEKSQKTVADIISLGAKETRIYPCLVIQNTELEQLYLHGDYKALSLAEAIEWSAAIYDKFSEAHVNVLRIGLHVSEELNGSALVAGPYHPNFAEMVFSYRWKKRFENFDFPKEKEISIFVNPVQRTHAIGYQAENKKMLLQRFQKVSFIADANQKLDEFVVNVNL